MKQQNIMVIFLSVLFVFLISTTVNAGTKIAPTFNLPGIKQNINLSDYKGKVVYLDFWASWCKPCRESFPWMNAMQEQYSKQGFEVIAINLDREKPAALTFLAENPTKFTIAFDAEGVTPSLYNVIGMPSSYIIDRQGRLIYTQTGFNETEQDKYEAHIQAALLMDQPLNNEPKPTKNNE